MATIIVETGAIVAGANSYISEAQLTTYATDRGIASFSTSTDVLLILAMDYIEAKNFQGVKYTEDQSLVWPRVGVFVDDYYINFDEIPDLLKDAVAATAIAIDEGNDPLANVARATKRVAAGSVSVEYFENKTSVVTVKKINAKLCKLLIGSDSRTFGVTR